MEVKVHCVSICVASLLCMCYNRKQVPKDNLCLSHYAVRTDFITSLSLLISTK